MPTRSLCLRSNSSSAMGLEPLAREMIGSLHHCDRMPEMERRLPRMLKDLDVTVIGLDHRA